MLDKLALITYNKDNRRRKEKTKSDSKRKGITKETKSKKRRYGPPEN